MEQRSYLLQKESPLTGKAALGFVLSTTECGFHPQIREGSQKVMIQMVLTLSSLMRFSRLLKNDSSFAGCPWAIPADFNMFVFQTVVSFLFPVSFTN